MARSETADERGDWPPPRALLDVKGRIGWTAARVPVDIQVDQGTLRIAVDDDAEPSGKERKALQRLFRPGAEGGGSKLALAVDLKSAELSFPGAPGRRSWIVIDQRERPTFRLYFLDWKHLEERLASFVRMGKHAVESRSAADARNAWREAIEAETLGPSDTSGRPRSPTSQGTASRGQALD